VRDRVLIIAAPFGYGPAARALLIANALADLATVTLLSSRDAYLFIERHRAPHVRCLEGIFSRLFPGRERLAEFDTFISINNDPAVRHLIAAGLAERTIFVDSILPWRAEGEAAEFAQPICAYVVQDFPGASSRLATCHAHRVELTAPIVWPRGADPAARTAQDEATGARTIALHLGGVTSPVVPWEAIRRPIEAIVDLVVDLARQHQCELTVLGNRHLESLPINSGPPHGSGVRLVAQANPAEAAALVECAELLVTTPGIGMVYEAMARDVPTLLLPPMNSTQLHQYSVLTALGYPGAMSGRAASALQGVTKGAPWDRQTVLAVRWLQANLAEALAALPSWLDRLLSDRGKAAARDDLLRRQASLRESLSQLSAIDVLRDLVVALASVRDSEGQPFATVPRSTTPPGR
jgi:hypothetical protein